MKMVAIQTVRRGRLTAPADSSKGIAAQYKRETLAPGDEFEADADEADALIASGAAKKKTREVADDSDAPASDTKPAKR